jgi:branched-subunit amino acid ABC-type transport system permease component
MAHVAGMGIALILQTTNVMNFAQGDTGMFIRTCSL